MLRSDPWLGYRVLGFVDDTATDPEPVAGVPLLGTIADAADLLNARSRASVIVAASAIESATTNRLARDLLDRGVHVELSSTLRDIASQRLVVRPLGRFPVVYVEPVHARRLAQAWPSGPSTSSWRRWASRHRAGPRRRRHRHQARLARPGALPPGAGRAQRPSRSACSSSAPWCVDAEDRRDELLEANEADGPLFKMENDPRITRVGRVPAQDVHRRAAPALERAPGRDEPGRAPPGAAPRDRGLGSPPHPAPAGHARHHRHVAGQRAQRHVVRGLHPPRPLLRRQLVAADRPGHPGQDAAGRAGPAQGAK